VHARTNGTERAEKASAQTVDLAALLAGREGRAYDPSSRFEVGEVLRHPSFGKGLVTQILAPQKMEAVFPGGPKLLMHDRAAASAPTLVRPARRDDDEKTPPTDAPPRR
jgi:hypothetical protein